MLLHNFLRLYIVIIMRVIAPRISSNSTENNSNHIRIIQVVVTMTMG